MRGIWLLVVCAACSKSGGGGDKKGSGADVPKNVTIEAKDNYTGGVDLDGYGVSGNISFSSLTVDLKVPEGTTGTLDGRALPVSGTSIKGPFMLGDSAAELDLTSSVHEFNKMSTATVTMKLALALPRGSLAETTLPLDALATKAALMNLLVSVEKGPVTFPGETASSGPAKTAAYIQLIGGSTDLMALIGGATKTKEVDLVAVAHEDVRTVPCAKEYTDGTNRYTVNRFVFDDDVHLFDRRTGKEVGAKKFAGKVPKCTRTTTGDFYGDDNKAAITKWITGQLAA